MSVEKIFQIDKKEICITSSQIKQAIDLLVNENEILRDKVYKLEEQLQQKESIIKEVRKYIEMHTPSDIGICGNKTKRYYTLGEDSVDHILEILDGENNDK